MTSNVSLVKILQFCPFSPVGWNLTKINENQTLTHETLRDMTMQLQEANGCETWHGHTHREETDGFHGLFHWQTLLTEMLTCHEQSDLLWNH